VTILTTRQGLLSEEVPTTTSKTMSTATKKMIRGTLTAFSTTMQLEELEESKKIDLVCAFPKEAVYIPGCTSALTV